MNTTTLSITLPDSLWAFVEEQATRAGYGSASLYVESLIRAEQKRQAEAELEALLLEGLESERRPMTAEDWEAIRRTGRQCLKERKTS